VRPDLSGPPEPLEASKTSLEASPRLDKSGGATKQVWWSSLEASKGFLEAGQGPD
jgi:hypothetical protein